MHDDPTTETQPGRAAKCQLHAVLVQVFDTGVLIVGESGIGKSECALDLVARGHRLIADDAVEIYETPNGISGRAPELTRDLLEIRGLGILRVTEIFGQEAFCDASGIDVCIELRKRVEAEPLQDAISQHEVAGVPVPKFTLPVSPGRNLATLVETAVRIFRRGAPGAVSRRLVEEHSSLLDSIR